MCISLYENEMLIFLHTIKAIGLPALTRRGLKFSRKQKSLVLIDAVFSRSAVVAIDLHNTEHQHRVNKKQLVVKLMLELENRQFVRSRTGERCMLFTNKI